MAKASAVSTPAPCLGGSRELRNPRAATRFAFAATLTATDVRRLPALELLELVIPHRTLCCSADNQASR